MIEYLIWKGRKVNFILLHEILDSLKGGNVHIIKRDDDSGYRHSMCYMWEGEILEDYLYLLSTDEYTGILENYSIMPLSYKSHVFENEWWLKIYLKNRKDNNDYIKFFIDTSQYKLFTKKSSSKISYKIAKSRKDGVFLLIEKEK